MGSAGDVLDVDRAGRLDTVTEVPVVGPLVVAVLPILGKAEVVAAATDDTGLADMVGGRGSNGVRAPAALGIMRVRCGLLRTR